MLVLVPSVVPVSEDSEHGLFYRDKSHMVRGESLFYMNMMFHHCITLIIIFETRYYLDYIDD
jgi:hypothetical protein